MKSKQEVRVEFTNLFNKNRKTAPLEIKIAFMESLEIFLENQQNETFRNHPLKGKYSGMRSIDVTEDWRALYREEGKRIIFVALGTHEQLYGKNSK